MLPGTDQLRLLWAAALVALPLAAGYRFARRLQSPTGAISDAILLSFLIQYISVGVAGVLGFLSPIFLSLGALMICTGLWISAGYIAPTSKVSPLLPGHRRWVEGFCLGAFGFVAALVYSQRLCPPLATDALTYHLPAAVLWLQKRRMVIFQTWFFNPANTYSPLAGSMFMTWLLAPIGNDALARFVQVQPWILILFAVVTIGGSGGAKAPAAALAAMAAVLSRPFISECILAKDDLFVAAFFLSAVSALSADRMSSRFGSARVGIALGLMLATKYTALMTLPILVLAVDAPFRAGWRWRQWGVAIGAAVLIAGPWYLRNLICWRNPLFPMKLDFPGIHLPGLLPSLHVQALRTLDGLWGVMTRGYYGLPSAVFILLFVIWLLAVARFGRVLSHDPLWRLLVLGPPVGITVFALFSPQAEVRFLLPSFGLLFALCPVVARGWSFVLSAAVALIAIATSFSAGNADQITNFAMWGVALSLIGLLVRWLETDFWRLSRPILSCTCVGVVIGLIGVRWNHYLDEYRDARLGIWEAVYPARGAMWSFVDKRLPVTATVAYSNQFMVYPLYGFDQRRNVIYAPVRQGASVGTLVFPERMSDSDLNQRATEAANAPADPRAWKQNLDVVRADYFVAGLGTNAPEVGWANADPIHFVRVFENADSVIYRIDGASGSGGFLLK